MYSYPFGNSLNDTRISRPSLSDSFLFLLIHQQLKIKQIYCYYSLFNKYTKRCYVRVCNMILFPIYKFSVVGSSLFQTQEFFLLHNNETQMKIMVLNNKDTSRCKCIRVFSRMYMRVYVYKNVHMCV